jgi:hypothetical protein
MNRQHWISGKEKIKRIHNDADIEIGSIWLSKEYDNLRIKVYHLIDEESYILVLFKFENNKTMYEFSKETLLKTYKPLWKEMK